MRSRRPPRLVRVYADAPLYFVTFCTKNRKRLLASVAVHEAFLEAAGKVNTFGNAIGCYVIMPDHIHLFIRIAPNGRLAQAIKCIRETITKRLRRELPGLVVWQAGFFDHAMRSAESYSEKWAYVRSNPVRAGLVKTAEEWAFQGEVVSIRW